MAVIEEVLLAIKSIETKGTLLSKQEVISVLEATKIVTKNEQLISSLIFFMTTLNFKALVKTKNLTNRELQVLCFIGLGNKSNEIANKLYISISTIETHRKNIRKKLGLIGKGELLEYAILNNLHQIIDV